ncbi:MAG: glycerophosphodiester phosphodiesterase family protein [Cohaesibacter sp.]|nr:glycerophosphodiester phosphodiesterase family protein [Cohaesibacter sp.]
MTNALQTPSSGRVIEIHGHRGARGVLPENTLEGFAYVLGIGVKIIELDIQLSSDGVFMTTHDKTLAKHGTRDCNGAWLEEEHEVIAMTKAALQQYDVGGLKAGSDYGARFPDQAFLSDVSIPSLEEVISLIKEVGDGDEILNIEIKSDATLASHRARVEEVASKLVALIQHHDFDNRVLLQSFDWSLMEALTHLAPHMQRACLSVETSEFPDSGKGEKGTVYQGSVWIGSSDYQKADGCIPCMIAKAGIPVWGSFFKDLTAERLARAHALGLKVNVWTVNEPDDIAAMIEMGVDGIISDYPGRVQRLLLEKGCHWLAQDQR